MHNRLYYQEHRQANLETDFLSQGYWNDQYNLVFENHRHSSFSHHYRIRNESRFRKTPWDTAF